MYLCLAASVRGHRSPLSIWGIGTDKTTTTTTTAAAVSAGCTGWFKIKARTFFLGECPRRLVYLDTRVLVSEFLHTSSMYVPLRRRQLLLVVAVVVVVLVVVDGGGGDVFV